MIYEAISISLYVSILSTILGLLISIPMGIFLGVKNFYFKKIILSILTALTSIPPVCAGLIVYLMVSRTGPFGWMGILYTPTAMIIAQTLIIFPIMTTLIARNISDDFPVFSDELYLYGARLRDIAYLLIKNRISIYLTISLIGFGRAISEYGAAAIVGGSIDHVTRNVTSTIALETSKGNLLIAINLGIILMTISFIISYLINLKK
ncbi:MAG: ABC transporter permease [Pelagibacteraceae bacterium]|nr:ABC transporter permease [Pelagibacteraceae bacterium]|tara:strand:+ start:2571 stop:3191 length:621 start_codon:yes stop_codon:yes gene_type:complete